jgi:uncharacterized protein (TIGR04255 family)
MKLTAPSNRHYPKAPITEAVIDLRVQLPAGFPTDDLKRVHKGEEKKYPNIEGLQAAIGQMQFGASTSASARTKPIGFMFKSTDDKQLYQAQTNGFTMSRLAPYQTWDAFRGEARRLWNTYRTVAKPAKVLRVAVRYINRIDIPSSTADLKDYLRTGPELSPDLPQSMSGYFMNLTLPVAEAQCEVRITQTILAPEALNVIPVLLDIDIYRTQNLPPDDSELWAIFEQLRHIKNNVFEACITDNSRKLFQ